MMLVLAVTLHNIPEGMAIGVVFVGMLTNSAEISLSSAIVLSILIVIQNFPEGAIILMILKSAGLSKIRAFLYGIGSGIVEPLGVGITILLTSYVTPFLPYFLGKRQMK